MNGLSQNNCHEKGVLVLKEGTSSLDVGGGEIMVAFVEEVSFELGFHRLLGLGDVQKLGWEKTFWAEQWVDQPGRAWFGREASNEFRK